MNYGISCGREGIVKSRKSLLLSIFIWGSGQFLICRQHVKGILFFFVQALVIGIELQTGYWLEWLTGKIPVFELRLCGGFFTRGWIIRRGS